MNKKLTKQEEENLLALKGLTKVLNDYLWVISHGKDPSAKIKEAVESIDYFKKKMSSE